MKSTYLLSSFPIVHYLANEEIGFILDAYCYKKMANIPQTLRRLKINKVNITARSFTILFERNYLDNPGRPKTISPKEIERLCNLYETLRILSGPAGRSSRGKRDFDLRCKVVSELIPMPAEAINHYMYGNPRRFHLFGCLNEAIFEHLKLSKNKREILKHQFGFSDKYEQIQKSKLAKRQNISKSSVTSAAAVISRKTDDAIRRFKFLEPYYSYKENYKLDRGVVEVTAEMCERIRKEEGAAGITPCFAARVFALIYNFRIRRVPYGGEFVYFLVPGKGDSGNIMQTPESAVDKKSFKRLFENMGKDVEAMEGFRGLEDFMNIWECMMKRGKMGG